MSSDDLVYSFQCRIKELEQENEKLKAEIEELKKINKDYLSYDAFVSQIKENQQLRELVKEAIGFMDDALQINWLEKAKEILK